MICICNIVQKIFVKSSVKISPLILFWWKTWQWSAILVAETTYMYLLEVKQCINNQISDSGSSEPLVCKILLYCCRYLDMKREGFESFECHIWFSPATFLSLYITRTYISIDLSLLFLSIKVWSWQKSGIYIVVVGFILLDIILYNLFCQSSPWGKSMLFKTWQLNYKSKLSFKYLKSILLFEQEIMEN